MTARCSFTNKLKVYKGMTKSVLVTSFVFAVLSATAQRSRFNFDFGSPRVAPGWIAVTAGSRFTPSKGFGFHGDPELAAVDVGGKGVTGDYITSHKPFYFSVVLPEGNYDVRVTLGDKKGTSATTVRAECRRLLLENIRTKKGEIRTETFTVHMRDSVIRDAAAPGVVRLKPREKNYFHWDNMLTLEFNDSLPKVCAVEIIPNTHAITVFLAGNSTVVDQDREPWAAWGQMFPRFFKSSAIAVANYAESGETLLAFKGERRLAKILSLSKPGDYLFIEFAHNDQKPGSSHLDAFTGYKQTLKEWISIARSKMITPVLVTSMHRRSFDSLGQLINTLLDYPEAMRQVATEEKVFLVDLHAMSSQLYRSWGVEGSLKAFVHYPPNTFPGQREALKDNTHFSPYGAYELAKCVVSAIRTGNLLLARFIRDDMLPYSPQHPMLFETFYWPLSPFRQAIVPDGN